MSGESVQGNYSGNAIPAEPQHWQEEEKGREDQGGKAPATQQTQPKGERGPGGQRGGGKRGEQKEGAPPKGGHPTQKRDRGGGESPTTQLSQRWRSDCDMYVCVCLIFTCV